MTSRGTAGPGAGILLEDDCRARGPILVTWRRRRSRPARGTYAPTGPARLPGLGVATAATTSSRRCTAACRRPISRPSSPWPIRWSPAGRRARPEPSPLPQPRACGRASPGSAYVLPTSVTRRADVGAPAGRPGSVPGARSGSCPHWSPTDLDVLGADAERGSAAGCGTSPPGRPGSRSCRTTCATGSTPGRGGGSGSGPSWSRHGGGWPGTAAPGRWSAWRRRPPQPAAVAHPVHPEVGLGP